MGHLPHALRPLRLTASLLGLFALGGIVSTSSGCGGPTEKGCLYENWSGTCQLQQLTLVRTIDAFPQSFVVLEAMYAPQDHGGNYTPGAVREEIRVGADQEDALRAHLEANKTVQCKTAQVTTTGCAEGKLALNIPPYQTVDTRADTGPKGCQQLETNPELAQENRSATAMSTLQFEENSESLKPEVQAQIQTVAGQMKSDPAIECVAISGYITPGEGLGLAERRARAIKSALVAAGVDSSRFVTYGATVGVANTEEARQMAKAENRKVTLHVIIRKK